MFCRYGVLAGAFLLVTVSWMAGCVATPLPQPPDSVANFNIAPDAIEQAQERMRRPARVLLPLPKAHLAPKDWLEGRRAPAAPALRPGKLPAHLVPVGDPERGIASWYAEQWAWKPTASGEIYDPNSMTAAHKTLPFESKVWVRNLDNGKTLLVRINNRGPFIKGRIIDLSPAAAKRLGCYDKGLAKVEIIPVK